MQDLQPIRERIEASGATLLEKGMEYDAYFDNPERNFTNTDEALPIREANNYALITYKGPKVGSGSIKTREELNIKVESREIMEAFFQRIGFQKTASVKKFRESYSIGKATVTFDQVDELGSFTEIEAVSELSQRIHYS